jgi:hypothetical protein
MQMTSWISQQYGRPQSDKRASLCEIPQRTRAEGGQVEPVLGGLNLMNTLTTIGFTAILECLMNFCHWTGIIVPTFWT